MKELMYYKNHVLTNQNQNDQHNPSASLNQSPEIDDTADSQI